jgi:hypothetical protein
MFSMNVFIHLAGISCTGVELLEGLERTECKALARGRTGTGASGEIARVAGARLTQSRPRMLTEG